MGTRSKSPSPFDDFALVHMSLKGSAEFESDGQRVRMPEGTMAVVEPKKNLRLCPCTPEQ
ncbi:hypothetical protein CD932_00410 [Janthinobacterium sp. PC23-8]|nr:hypothetical protein CD932_00410 [Janthinobacterium sp. PC23-8]